MDKAKNYGFIIDNRKCIGCHACSTACKSENEVPLGVYRTWVKYVEVGAYPNVRRHFQVTRCNHCANPPCVRICPTAAMYQRVDGIVEFDGDLCIGCKACMQACPYDAIYIDPETDTAAKCHYCAHRTDIGLEPACVVVCPEHAIIAGDMNDPHSEISHLLATQAVTVRKPEQGTAPKLFYIDGNDVALHPTATPQSPQTYLWADVLPAHETSISGGDRDSRSASERRAQAPALAANDTRRAHQPQGQPWSGPIHIGEGSMATHMVQTSYNAQHKAPWHWPVPAYLVTKGVGAGLFIILSLGLNLELFVLDRLTIIVAGFCSLLGIGLTTALLVYDLEKPERFFYILRRPQWRSWLARGAVILILFSVVCGSWWALETAVYLGVAPVETLALSPLLLWLGLPLAILAAIYTAFLFAQAEGRDLWQSPLLPVHLVVEALVAGSASLLLIELLASAQTTNAATRILLALALIVDLFAILVGEFAIPHASEVAARAAYEISHGRFRTHFWWGAIVVGHLLPLAALWFAGITGGPFDPIFTAVAGMTALAGLYLFEYAFVMAPQTIANS